MRVYSVSRSGVLRAQGVDVPDIYQTILEFGNGAIATMENHWIMPDSSPQLNDFKVNILGSKGMFNMDLTHNQLIERYLANVSDRPDVLDGPLIRGKHVGFVHESIKHFVDCVADGKQPEVTLQDGVRVSKVILAIMESAKCANQLRSATNYASQSFVTIRPFGQNGACHGASRVAWASALPADWPRRVATS